MDDHLKDKRKQLEGAINDALAESPVVSDLIQDMRKDGYDVFLIIEATVGFSKRKEETEADGESTAPPEGVPSRLELTSQDEKFLRSLKISPR